MVEVEGILDQIEEHLVHALDSFDKAKKRFSNKVRYLESKGRAKAEEFSGVFVKFKNVRSSLYLLLTDFIHLTRVAPKKFVFSLVGRWKTRLEHFYSKCAACYGDLFELIGSPQGSVAVIEDVDDANSKYVGEFADVLSSLHFVEYHLRIIYDEDYRGAHIGEEGELIEVPLKTVLAEALREKAA